MLFPLFWTFFLQVVSSFVSSPPSGLCLNVTFPSGFTKILIIPSPLSIPYSLPVTYFSSMALLTIGLTEHFRYGMWALWEPGTLLFSLIYSQVLAQCLQYSSCLVNTQWNLIYFILPTTLRSRSHYYHCSTDQTTEAQRVQVARPSIWEDNPSSLHSASLYTLQRHISETQYWMDLPIQEGVPYAQPCALTPALASSWHSTYHHPKEAGGWVSKHPVYLMIASGLITPLK